MKPVGLAIVGCGQWGLNYLRTFRELDGARLVAVCDVSAERRHEVERRLPGIQTTGDLEVLLANPEIDAVVIAVEATRHFAIASAVLQAGKDCLVEKPLTTDSSQARRLRDQAAAGQRVLMVGHIFRYNPAINYVQKLLAAGGIGEVEYLYFTRTNLGPIRSDVNVAWDLMAHDVSILLHFMNETPAWVSAQGASFLRQGCEDIAFATVGFESGVVANIRASWLDPRKVREITVVGTTRMIVIDDLDATAPVRIFDKGATREPAYGNFGEFKLVTRTGDVTIPAIASAEPLRTQCLAFLDSVRTRKPPISDAADGLRVVEIVSAINASIAERGSPVSLRPVISPAAAS